MAIGIAAEYPGKTNGADANYPQGSAKNVSSPGSGDGTPWEEAWVNDKEGFFQRLLSDASITPSGSPDTIVNSDYVDALTKLVNSTTLKILSSAGYTVLDNDLVQTILVTTGASDQTIILPAVANNPGRRITIKKVDSGIGEVIVKTLSAGETIDGVDGTVGVNVIRQYESITCVEGSSVYNVEKSHYPKNEVNRFALGNYAPANDGLVLSFNNLTPGAFYRLNISADLTRDTVTSGAHVRVRAYNNNTVAGSPILTLSLDNNTAVISREDVNSGTSAVFDMSTTSMVIQLTLNADTWINELVVTLEKLNDVKTGPVTQT